MQYIPCTKAEEKEMLEYIGVDKFENLIDIIPDNILFKDELNIGKPLSEYDCEIMAKKLINGNNPASEGLCFLGGGVYDHYVPKVVDAISARSEFYTAYTPYQPEVSQGTLQYLYEFQTMICELSGMDVANASLYDGGSAVAEACSLAVSATRNKTILISKSVNPKYSSVVETYLKPRDIKIRYIDLLNNGKTNLSIINNLNDDIAGIVIQSPNYFGNLEDWSKVKESMGNSKALLIGVSDPNSLSLLKPPGECGVDIYAGEGQSLGNYMSYGGPYLGLLSAKKKFLRKMPGRIIGKTTDKNNKNGFVLTLQTREQHIRRENATSNICTNQGLIALRACVYMSLLGKNGLPGIAKICYDKAHYTARKLNSLENIEFPFGMDFIKEFTIKVDVSARQLKKKAQDYNIFINDIEYNQNDNLIQICLTEKRTKNEIDKLISFFENHANS